MPVITDSQALAEFCANLKNSEFITVDTEFLREKTYYPKLCLIQVSCPEKEARAIDPLAENIDLTPLFDLLKDQNILKVFHAGRQDLEIFYTLMGTVPAPVFDTQIAAMVCGYGDSIGYDKLVRNILDESIDKSSQFTDWSYRPLSEKQINYALGDVTHLCGVFLHLHAELEKRGRQKWVEQENEIQNSADTYKLDPYDAWAKVRIRNPKAKNLAVLRELAAWREIQAQKRNIPKSWVVRDDALAEIALNIPQTEKQLSKVRNIPKDLTKEKNTATLLKLIDTALNSSKEQWPKPPVRKQHPPSVSATIDILKLLLKLTSLQHEVAAKVIANADDLEAIALSDQADVNALKGWRYEIFGKDALDVKNGKLAVGLKDGRINKFPLA